MADDAPRSRDTLDFLTMDFRGCGIERADAVFFVLEPWGLARFDNLKLQAGWWTFECEAEAAAEQVEVRLTTPETPLIVLKGDQASPIRLFFQRQTILQAALLISAWPRNVGFLKLRLRKLNTGEQLQLAIDGVLRLVRTRKPISKIVHVVERLLAGAPLGIRAGSVVSNIKDPTDLRARKPKELTRYVPFLSHHKNVTIQLHRNDQVDPRALSIVEGIFDRSADVMAVYSDAREGGVVYPVANWDPELAKSYNYSSQPLFIRREFHHSLGGDWTSIADIVAAKGRNAVTRVSLPLVSRPHRLRPDVRLPTIPQLSSLPPVSIIIPTKYRIELLDLCLTGLKNNTGYSALEVVLVDNGSTDARLPSVIKRHAQSLCLTSIRDCGDFNFSRLVNAGVRHSGGKIVVLLNDDVQPVMNGWLHRMVSSCLDASVGAVGARLHYPNHTIQHAGVVLGIGGVAGHLWRGVSETDAQLFPQVIAPGSRLAVTGACLAVRRECFEEVDGFDEMLAVALNDIDFCLRLNARGRRTIYRGDAVLMHHESQSRGQDDASAITRRRLSSENRIFMSRWRELIESDPYGSPAFDPTSESGSPHHAVEPGSNFR